jgi:hypothetical protein
MCDLSPFDLAWTCDVIWQCNSEAKRKGETASDELTLSYEIGETVVPRVRLANPGYEEDATCAYLKTMP